MPSIPLSAIQEFRDFEDFLSNNENVFYISGSGYLCKVEEKSARKLLAKLLSNELASQFTYHGATGKRTFKDTHLGEVFESALLTSFKNDLSDAKDAAGKWFRNAPWRKPSDGASESKRASNEGLQR
ncbi:Phosphate acyltransferase [Frankliniella fusca]|uniref:Phosphate acyltransferase n=1 Tax=Frankliniella fusca TaxID=407009 RepID=A0AAE1LRI9_9NEOP|nr:Phosphate acyltransferase [Frankliniella fusca]